MSNTAGLSGSHFRLFKLYLIYQATNTNAISFVNANICSNICSQPG